MRNFFAGYTRHIYTKRRAIKHVSMLMLVTIGYQFLLADSASSFPIFSNTTESQSAESQLRWSQSKQPRTELDQKSQEAWQAEFEDRVTAAQEQARYQAEQRAKDQEKAQDEVQEAGRQAAKQAEQRIAKDIAGEERRSTALAEHKNMVVIPESRMGSSPVMSGAVSIPVELEPKPEPDTMPAHELAYKTQEVTDAAEYLDVLQKKYADQREQKISTAVVKFPQKLDLADLPSRSKEVDGNYARIRIGAYDFAFKMIDGAWTIEFFDVVYRYDNRGVRIN